MTATSDIVAAARPDQRRLTLAGVAAASMGVLSAAFLAEYVFGLEPCILCLYQRIPWGIAAVGAILGFLLPLSPTARTWIALGLGVVLLAGAALGLYSVGVEQHWWASVAGCGGGPVGDVSVEDLAAALAKPSTLRACDAVDWQLFGLSLAGFNTLGSMVAGGSLFAWILRGRLTA